MIYRQNKKAAILIYIIFLVTISLVFATIVLNNHYIISSYGTFSDYEISLYSNIRDSSIVSVNTDKHLNSNGSGFVDNISCPTSVTMSGSSFSGVIDTFLAFSDPDIFCSGTYLSDPLRIYFNSGFTDFTEADLDGYSSLLNSGIGDFLDSDLTHIDFSSSSYNSPDLIDDDFNSDDYRGTSTGTTSYPDGFTDDDDLARKYIFGYVSVDDGLKKVFWNNSKTSEIISENKNNTGALNINIGDLSDGYLYLDINKPYSIRLYRFNKSRYDEFNELIIEDKVEYESTTGKIGYLQSNGDLSTNLSGSEYSFNFRDNDYAVFLASSGTGTLIYSINAEENSTANPVYINPIDDSLEGVIKVVGNEIIIDSEARLISKQIELIYNK